MAINKHLKATELHREAALAHTKVAVLLQEKNPSALAAEEEAHKLYSPCGKSK